MGEIDVLLILGPSEKSSPDPVKVIHTNTKDVLNHQVLDQRLITDIIELEG